MISHHRNAKRLTHLPSRVHLTSDERVSVDTDITPVSTDDLKAYLVIEHSDDDALLEALLDTAVAEFEARTNHYLDEQTRAATYDGVTDSFRIPAKPFGSLAKVESLDEGAATDEGASNFYVAGTEPAEVRIKRGTSFEHPLQEIKITYTCGYSSASAVPAQVVMILKKMVADLYEFRTSVHQDGQIPRELPMQWKEMLSPVSLIWL